MIYWTKPELVWDEDQNMNIPTGKLIDIQQSAEDFVPDGDGFAIDLGKISYSSYLKNPDNYEIVEGKLVKKGK